MQSMRKLVAACAACASFAAASPSAEAQQVTISSSQKLSSDITCTSSPCLVIAADGITLDGARHKVDCKAVSTCVLLASRTGVTIENLEIVNAPNAGITVAGGSGNVLLNDSVHDGYIGVFLYSATSGDTISSCRFANNAFGVFMTDTSNDTLSGNTVLDSNVMGISVGAAPGSVISGNTVKGTASEGIYLQAVASGVEVTGNRTSGNYAGISVAGAGNTIDGNTSGRNTYAGIYVSGTGNSIHDNATVNNGGYDLVDTNAGCDGNTWQNDRFKTANQSCID